MSVRAVAVDGFDGVRLAAGSLEAAFVPAAGMVGASLRHLGEERLDRLASDRYAIDGRAVELPHDLPRDANGLSIHGVLPREWRILSAHGCATSS